MGNKTFVLQSQIERKTGFGIDQLRKWRQRYGFPPAETGVDGGAVYSNETITKLALIKRLIEAGLATILVCLKLGIFRASDKKTNIGMRATICPNSTPTLKLRILVNIDEASE